MGNAQNDHTVGRREGQNKVQYCREFNSQLVPPLLLPLPSPSNSGASPVSWTETQQLALFIFIINL